jgi:hypothetical protein
MGADGSEVAKSFFATLFTNPRACPVASLGLFMPTTSSRSRVCRGVGRRPWILACCNRCGDPIRWGQDVITRKWIPLDPAPTEHGRYVFRSPKGIVDMAPFPQNFEDLPVVELVRLPADKRALLRRLYVEERYQDHRAASCPLPPGVVAVRVPLREALLQLGEAV